MARQLTITVEDEVAEKLEKARKNGAPVDAAVTEALRGVAARLQTVTAKPFVVRPFDMGEPLIDLTCTGRALEALDELERQ